VAKRSRACANTISGGHRARHTAALGCAAEAELPLTFRNEATRSFVTRIAPMKRRPGLSGLAGSETTVVVYMALRRRGSRRPGSGQGAIRRRRRLLRAWHAADPARGGGRLENPPTLAASAGDGPALLVVGNVVAHSRPWREALEFLNAQVAA
jgi:uroporphyrin-III C-methyltransferase/precorrin-2 dehydrogenase/sirohydrochlorin ferrochelatase